MVKVIDLFLNEKTITPEDAYSNGLYIALDLCNEEFQINEIKKDGTLIQYIKIPSEAVQLVAIKKCLSAIQYINRPSIEMQLIAVKRYGCSIEYIKNPREVVQLFSKM